MPKRKPPKYSTVINGRLVEVRLRRTSEDGNHVECLVFAGDKSDSQILGEWVMPYELRYYLTDLAVTAARQTA